MREMAFGESVYCISSDMHAEGWSDDDPELSMRNWFKYGFFRRRLFREITEIHARQTGLRGLIQLNAHGYIHEGAWFYHDGQRQCRMQNWVNRYDGKASVLCLVSCNSYNRGTITAKKSIVIHATSALSFMDLWRRIRFRIFVPPYGYLDSCTKIRRTINKLEALDSV